VRVCSAAPGPISLSLSPLALRQLTQRGAVGAATASGKTPTSGCVLLLLPRLVPIRSLSLAAPVPHRLARARCRAAPRVRALVGQGLQDDHVRLAARLGLRALEWPEEWH
jgi:hypothetical protein